MHILGSLYLSQQRHHCHKLLPWRDSDFGVCLRGSISGGIQARVQAAQLKEDMHGLLCVAVVAVAVVVVLVVAILDKEPPPLHECGMDGCSAWTLTRGLVFDHLPKEMRLL